MASPQYFDDDSYRSKNPTTSESSTTTSVPSSNLPDFVILPKTTTIAPAKPRRGNVTHRPGHVTFTHLNRSDPQIIVVPLPSRYKNSTSTSFQTFPSTTHPASVSSHSFSCGVSLASAISSSASITLSKQSLVGTDSEVSSSGVTKLQQSAASDTAMQVNARCLTGCQVFLNGESGIFLPSHELENNNIKINVIKPSYSHTDTMRRFPLAQGTAVKSTRTVGISAEPSAPIEIGMSPQVLSHPAASSSFLWQGEKILPGYSHLPVAQAATQTAAEDCYDFDAFRVKHLPKSHKYLYNYTTINEEQNLIEFRVAGVTNRQTVAEWLQQLEYISQVRYRVWKTYKPKKEGAYKVDFRCHMNQTKSKKFVKGKSCDCPSMLSITIDPQKLSKGCLNRRVRTQFRCRVRFRYSHNHSVEEGLKHIPVMNSVKEKILECYEKGMGVSDSYTKHYNDLKAEYGDRYCDIMCNRGLCPDKGYFYSLWKQFSKDRFGTVVKPPKSVVPKIPWNKGLRGITSLKEFEDILPSENNSGGKRKRGGPTKRERIKQVALDSIESTLMESIRQSPETYSRAVACFVQIWESMDDKGRLAWLQTKIESHTSDPVTIITTDSITDDLQATETILHELNATEHSYSDIVVTTQPPVKKIKLSESVTAATSRDITEYSFELSDSGVPFYRVTSL